MAKHKDTPGLAEKLEWAGKVIGVALAAVYMLGLVVVTLHLGRYGVSGLGLLHEQYIVTGVWVVLPPVIVSIMIAAALGNAAQEAQPNADNNPGSPVRPAESRLVGMLFALLTVFIGWPVVSGFFLTFLSQFFPHDEGVGFGTWELIQIAIYSALFTAAAAFFLSGGLWFIRTPLLRFKAVGTGLVFLSVAPMLGYVGYFTRDVYPNIPAAFGGGHAVRVEILLKDDVEKFAPSKDGSYLLLFVTADAYIVEDPSNTKKAFELQKGQVSAVRHLPPKPPDPPPPGPLVVPSKSR